MSGNPGVEIRPEVAMYSAFARLNYEPWYALAEFVDNALQSYLANRTALQAIHGASFRLHVGVNVSDDLIEIRDNAAGIAGADFPRAFRPASPPPDTSGLSEFGLGMKAAACWFSRRWSVSTSALGESVERTIVYDIPEITSRGLERLPVAESPYAVTDHYTHLRLEALNVRPKTSAIAKIKRHLASIYRMFLRDGSLDLRVQGEALTYAPPEFLRAARSDNPAGAPIEWRKDLALSLGEGRRIWGWAGLLSTASVVNAGFALFRRDRLIEGSHGDAYRPEVLFRKSNSYTFQRLIGEFSVEGFTVSHTKDGIQWDDLEEEVLHRLRHELDREPLPLLRQAEGYRARLARVPAFPVASPADTDTVVGQRVLPLVDAQTQKSSDLELPPSDLFPSPTLPPAETELLLFHQGQRWRVSVEIVTNEAVSEWLDIVEEVRVADEYELRLRINLAHPFLVRFISPGGPELTAFVRLGVALAMSESAARAAGVRQAGTVRRNLSQLLRGHLAGPVDLISVESNE
jgi:Histidine kinase-, DNA gyrase B-, and HSP90-like ATPase